MHGVISVLTTEESGAFLWLAQLQPLGNQKNIFSSPSLQRLWNDEDFHDVPLVCEDDRPNKHTK